MPFKSEKQRRLMYAAKTDPGVRKRYGIKKKAAVKMVAHDRASKIKREAGMT